MKHLDIPIRLLSTVEVHLIEGFLPFSVLQHGRETFRCATIAEVNAYLRGLARDCEPQS